MRNGIKHTVTWLCRLLTGGAFIFSGFSKSIDPWGTLYKFNEYFDALGINAWENLTLAAVMMLCVIEFVTGVSLLLGCFRRGAPILCAAIMAVMLPLTLWIAIADPVADCGCFGDALIISNWATFWKNVVLSAAAVWLIKFNSSTTWLITPALQWIALVAECGFIGCISLAGYNYQPLIDFRTNPIGSPIIEDNDDNSESFVFIYSKDGETKEFGETDDLPDEDSGWSFVERKSLNNDSGENNLAKKVNELRIWDPADGEDVSEEVLRTEGEQFIVLMPELRKVSVATAWQLNSLHDWSQKKNISMIAVVALDSVGMERWRDLAIPVYPIYTADDTSIKIVARGNPAIVYTRDGIIQWKSTFQSLGISDFMTLGTDVDAKSLGRDNAFYLKVICGAFLCVIGLLLALSYTPKLAILIEHALCPLFKRNAKGKGRTNNHS